MKSSITKPCSICTSSRSRSHRSNLTAILSIAATGFFLYFLFTKLHTKLSYLEQLIQTHTVPPPLSTTKNQACPFPIVYNKPHKTASTKIKMDLRRWARKSNRPLYDCSPYIDVAMLRIPECIPQDDSGCAVVATHIIMSPYITALLRERIGNYVLITSTRNPRDRLVSHFLQKHEVKAVDVHNLDEMKQYFRELNPWGLYNYQTGANMNGTCPMTAMEKNLLPAAIVRADVVIDAELREQSQEILNWKGLFNLTDKQSNVRGSGELELDEETESLIKNVSCVEEEMHRLYRLRMGGLYEAATGIKCILNQRDPITCFDG